MRGPYRKRWRWIAGWSLSPSFISRLFVVTVDFPSSDTGLFALLMESRAGVKEVLGSV